MSGGEVRCPHCGKLLVEQLRGWARLRCPRCKAPFEVTRGAPPP